MSAFSPRAAYFNRDVPQAVKKPPDSANPGAVGYSAFSAVSASPAFAFSPWHLSQPPLPNIWQ